MEKTEYESKKEKFNEIETNLLTLISESGNDTLMNSFLEWMEIRNELNQGFVEHVQSMVDTRPEPLPLHTGSGDAKKLLEKDNDISIVGNCANCGVEYHIHNTSKLGLNSILKLSAEYVSHHHSKFYSQMSHEDKIDFDIESAKLANFGEWLLSNITASQSNNELLEKLMSLAKEVSENIDVVVNLHSDKETGLISGHRLGGTLPFMNMTSHSLKLKSLLSQYEQR